MCKTSCLTSCAALAGNTAFILAASAEAASGSSSRFRNRIGGRKICPEVGVFGEEFEFDMLQCSNINITKFLLSSWSEPNQIKKTQHTSPR
mmetsp:Transcript_16301/g.20911  ORF Transcript_16301/g.20911 Transcript_16301/m.20911 type:complete len:91 (+) Transcript_16301:2245-2517(+)